MTRFGSVCSGIEAASVAWGPLGWQAAWLSETEAFPSAVLAHHYPAVPNLGDVRTLPERILSGEVEPPDVLCGGTPCQAFSVAGLRQSMGDDRGNLSLVFCEIANAIDSRRPLPCIVFWENVPGVLSTKDNAFGCFLAGLAGEAEPLVAPGGRWSDAGYVLGPARAVAWRVLDAQYFGLAQRRRRVFVVASARNDIDPAEILFEFEGVRRDFAPRREAGEGVAATLTRGAESSGKGGYAGRRREDDVNLVAAYGGNNTSGPIDVATACNAHASASGRMDFERETFITCYDTTNVTSATNGSNPRPGAPCHTLAAGADPPLLVPAVRRLTVRECERLQGFPDNHTVVPYRGKPAPDGPRYRAIGNSWPVPVVRWIGQRIHNAIEHS